MKQALTLALTALFLFANGGFAHAGQVRGNLPIGGTVAPECDAHGDTDTDPAPSQGDSHSQSEISGSIGIKCHRGSAYAIQIVALSCKATPDPVQGAVGSCQPIQIQNPDDRVFSDLNGVGTGSEQTFPFDLVMETEGNLHDRLHEFGLLDIVVVY